MKIRILEVVLVVTVALLSWLFMFSLEHYFGDWEDKSVHSENKPPFPDHLADNIFWFLQVIMTTPVYVQYEFPCALMILTPHLVGCTCTVTCMLTFLQITDIHFSFVNNLSISDSLQLFCHDVIETISPSLVIVSGDLTHAKFADERRSQQFPSEWKAYRTVLQKCNIDGIPWLDIRGNHGMYSIMIC